jgi:hypothetical protein
MPTESSVTDHSLQGYADRYELVELGQKKCAISSVAGDWKKEKKKKRK